MKKHKIFLFLLILGIAIGIAFLVFFKQSLSNKPRKPLPKVLTENISPQEERLVNIAEIKEIKDEIKTEAEGKIIKYQETSFYSKDDFDTILKNKEEFESQLTNDLNKNLVGVKISNVEVSLDKPEKSAILKCDIKKAMYSRNSYSMHFILGPLNLDLWRDFKPSKPPYGKRLIFNGEIKGVPTEIIFGFPFEISHCHEHIWQKD